MYTVLPIRMRSVCVGEYNFLTTKVYNNDKKTLHKINTIQVTLLYYREMYTFCVCVCVCVYEAPNDF